MLSSPALPQFQEQSSQQHRVPVHEKAIPHNDS